MSVDREMAAPTRRHPRQPRHPRHGRAALLALLVAALVSWAPAPATYAASGAGPSPSVRAASASDHAALQDAAVTLAGLGPRRPGAAHDEATAAMRELFLARPRLHGGDRQLADRLLARPTDGGADPNGDGYTTRAARRCSPHFCIHWVRTGTDAATEAWVSTTLRTMEQVWHHHIDELGYRAPPSDGHRGGNAKFDIYLAELGGQGLFGYCAPERPVPGRGAAASSYCVLDNDFARREYHRSPIEELRVTAAHEFFHAIQFGYDYHEDRWIMEATATWMEERFADSVNDNRTFLPYGQVGLPAEPLDVFDAAGFNQYGNWAFFEYLSEHYGDGIVRKIWQHLGNGRSRLQYSVQAMHTVLAHYGGLAKVYAAFVGGNVVAAQTYREGRHFPATQIAAQHAVSPAEPRWTYTTRLRHLSARDVAITAPGALAAHHWRLRLTFHGADRVTAPAAYVVVRTGHRTILRRPVRLGRHGYGRISVPVDSRTVGVTASLVNASTRYRCHRHTRYACAGRPLDDHVAFTLDAALLPR